MHHLRSSTFGKFLKVNFFPGYTEENLFADALPLTKSKPFLTKLHKSEVTTMAKRYEKIMIFYSLSVFLDKKHLPFLLFGNQIHLTTNN